MNITSAKYTTEKKLVIKTIIDLQTVFVPLDPANRHYQAILEWVEDGNTIEAAD